MVTKTINIQDSPPSLRELLSLVEDGAEVILVANGKPLARLVPVAAHVEPPRSARIFNLHPGAMVASDDFDEPLPDEFWMGEE